MREHTKEIINAGNTFDLNINWQPCKDVGLEFLELVPSNLHSIALV
jgi:hypothetical protein